MEKISLAQIFKRQRKIRLLSVLAFIATCALLGQLLIFNGGKKTEAAGDTESNPIPLDATGFIWGDGTNSYYVKQNDNPTYCYVRYVGPNHKYTGADVTAGASGFIVADGNGNNCLSTSWSNAHPGIVTKVTNLWVKVGNATNPNVYITMWGDNKFAGITVDNGAILSHAPLVYFAHGSGGNYNYSYGGISNADFVSKSTNSSWYDATYAPGYYIEPVKAQIVGGDSNEQDFAADTGVLTASGKVKKVSIISGKINIIHGQINVVGKGYPGANGAGSSGSDPNRVLLTDYDTTNPVGLPTNFGGAGGYRDASCSQDNTTRLYGGGGSGFAYSGGSGTSDIGGCPGSTVSSVNSSYGNSADPNTSSLLYGPGGGGSGNYSTAVDRGGSGGGRIELNGTVYFHLGRDQNGNIDQYSGTILNTGGQNGLDSSGSTYYAGGGGAGGTIFISGTVKVVVDASFYYPDYGAYGRGGVPVNGWGEKIQDKGDGNGYQSSLMYIQAYVDLTGGNGEKANTSGACVIGGGNTNCGGYGGAGAIVLDGTITGDCSLTNGDNYIPLACENKDVTIDGATVYSNRVTLNGDTKRHLNSLTIQNSGVLTHDALTWGGQASSGGYWNSDTDTNDDFNWKTGALTTHGKLKKVDLVLAGDLDVTTGGKIDVSGKGYTDIDNTTYCGGVNQLSRNHCDVKAGPGHGGIETDNGGGGGGHGGVGGNHGGPGSAGVGGGFYEYLPSNIYAVSNDVSLNVKVQNPILPGSAGGYGEGGTGYYLSMGGAGGGVVIISAANINLSGQTSVINANGFNGNSNNAGSSKGGGGAGGTINLTATGTLLVDQVDSLVARGGLGGTDNGEPGGNGAGGRISIKANGLDYTTYFNLVTGVYADVSARTPFNDQPSDYVSVQNQFGTIYVSALGFNSVSIQKTLKPISRTGVGAGFNPYSLLTNDKIEVDLILKNLIVGQTTTITDQLLTNGTVSCKSAVDVSGNGGTVSGGSMVWTLTPTSNTDSLAYTCIVQ